MRAAVVLAFVACSSRDKPPAIAVPPTVRSDAAVAQSLDAEARARRFLQSQIDAALARDEKRLLDTFTPDTIVLTPLAQPPSQISYFGIGDGAMHASSTGASISKLIAHGTRDAVWFYAEVAVQYEAGEGETSTGRTRVVELIAASEQWRAVAASFTSAKKPMPAAENLQMPNETENGPVAALLDKGDAALVIGPTDMGWTHGPVTRFGTAREVRTATWAFAQVALDHPAGKYVERLNAQVFAIPRGDSWQAVLIQYVAQ